MSIVNTITDLKDKVMEWVKSYAAPKTHVNQKASSNTLGHVMVDAGLNQNSINPVQNATIKSELDNKANKTDLLNNPIGCGPYKLTEYKSGSHVKFESSSDFFGGEVKTKNLVFKVINDDTTQAEFKSGSIDIATVEGLT